MKITSATFLSISLCVLSNSLNAQSLLWAELTGGSGNQQGHDVIDNSGNIYTVGAFSGLGDFDPGPGTYNMWGANSIYITKLNSDGDFIWAKQIDSVLITANFSNVSVDDSGSIYITGYFNASSVDFDPSTGSLELFSTGGYSIFVCKLDSTGSLVWATQFTNATQGLGCSISVDDSSNVYCTGQFNGTVDFDPSATNLALTSTSNSTFITKLSPSGNTLWAKQLENTAASSGSIGTGIMTEASGNVLFIGGFAGSVDFDPSSSSYILTNTGGTDLYICKFNSSGNFIWAKEFDGGSNNWSNGIALDNTGNIYTTGYFRNTCDFDPGAGTVSLTAAGSGGFGDIFICKLDSLGNYIWAVNIGSNTDDQSMDIDIDATGNVYTTGYFTGSADFDPGPGSHMLVSNGGFDNFIFKLDPNGNLLLATNIGSSQNTQEQGNSINVDASNNMIVFGTITGQVDFDPGQNIFNLNSGNGARYCMKLCPFPPLDTAMTIVGQTTLCSGDSVSYSIPFDSAAIGYSWLLPSGWFGYSSTNSINVVAYSNSGVVQVIKTNGCVFDTATIYVTVNTPSNFSYSVNNMVATFTMLDPGCVSSGQGFLWDYGNGTQNTLAQNPVWTYSDTGSYSVCLICNYSNCPVCEVITVPGNYSGNSNVGVVEVEENTYDFTAYPNPTSGFVNIQSPSIIESIMITDMIGRIVYYGNINAHEFKYDISVPGLYLVTATINGKNVTKKIIQQ